MAELGVPESYDVFIVQSESPSNPGRNTVVGELAYDGLKWQRLANDVSAASVVLKPNAMPMMQPLTGYPGGYRIPFVPRPWVHALRIYRNGWPVWGGPITAWGRDSSGQLTINAVDGAVAMRKQMVAAGRNFVNARVTEAVAQIFADCGLGDADSSAYAFTVGAFYPLGFYGNSYMRILQAAGGAAVGVGDACVTRELDVTRMEKVEDVIRDFVADGKFFWTFAVDHLYVNEPGIREQLEIGDGTGWPVLNEQNSVDTPTVNCDGIDISTVLYAPVVSTDFLGTHAVTRYATRISEPEGYTAWMFVNSPADPMDVTAPPLTEQAGLLESTIQRSQAGDVRVSAINAITHGEPTTTNFATNPVLYLGTPTLESSIDTTGAVEVFPSHADRAWVERTAPKVTVEKVTLQPSFSHPALTEDLSTLLPGTRFIVGWEDRTAFNVPVSEAKVGLAPATYDFTNVGAQGHPTTDHPEIWDSHFLWDWMLVTCWADQITHLKLMQVDVEVSVGSRGEITETVQLSLVPTTQYVLNGYSTPTVITQTYIDPDLGSVTASGTVPIRPRFVG